MVCEGTGVMRPSPYRAAPRAAGCAGTARADLSGAALAVPRDYWVTYSV